MLAHMYSYYQYENNYDLSDTIRGNVLLLVFPYVSTLYCAKLYTAINNNNIIIIIIITTATIREDKPCTSVNIAKLCANRVWAGGCVFLNQLRVRYEFRHK